MTTSKVRETSVATESSEDIEQITNNSIEVIRKCSTNHHIDTSWDQSHYVSFRERKNSECDKTPPFMSIMIDTESPDSKVDSSTQTELVSSYPGGIIDVNLSFGKDFKLEDTSSNEDGARFLNSKRFRHDSFEDLDKETRPTKKTKCTESNTSSTSDLIDKHTPRDSTPSSRLCSESEISFKSANSNYSYKTRKRRRKSDTSLIKNILQKSGRVDYFCKLFPENNSSGTWLSLYFNVLLINKVLYSCLCLNIKI